MGVEDFDSLVGDARHLLRTQGYLGVIVAEELISALQKLHAMAHALPHSGDARWRDVCPSLYPEDYELHGPCDCLKGELVKEL